jgi:hypothetical protein
MARIYGTHPPKSQARREKEDLILGIMSVYNNIRAIVGLDNKGIELPF